jgi:hypothetical protein
MIRQNLARGYGHFFSGLRVAASPVLLALHLEVTKAGYLEFTFFYQNSLHHFEDQFRDLLRFFPAEVQLFRNPLGNINFRHDLSRWLKWRLKYHYLPEMHSSSLLRIVITTKAQFRHLPPATAPGDRTFFRKS